MMRRYSLKFDHSTLIALPVNSEEFLEFPAHGDKQQQPKKKIVAVSGTGLADWCQPGFLKQFHLRLGR
jgi:hypothetical protein